jgi:ferredoxin-nitrite reductase
MGLERFFAEVEKRLPAPLPRLPLAECEPRLPLARGAHIGFHAQKDAGRLWCGVVLPAGKMTSAQMRGLADLAQAEGRGTLRLTVWQNVIVSDVAAERRAAAEQALAAIGLAASASEVRSGLVACTGNAGCKFAASDTKRHAVAIADHLDATVRLDTALNIHLTGCPNSCAQHYIGDIGLLGAKIGEAQAEGYHLFAGGGFGDRRGLGREILRDVLADEVPRALERLLRAYLEQRSSQEETFQAFANRLAPESLRAIARGRVCEGA